MALFGRSKTDVRKTAKSEYDKACTLRGDDRKEQAYQMKVALRCRAHIDKLFIEGAEGAELYNDAVLVCIAEGKPKPTPPKPSEYMKIKTASGEVTSYLPEEYAEVVFRYGMRYQTMECTAVQAIQAVQQIANSVSFELKVEHPLTALQFLRDQMMEEGVDIEAELAALSWSSESDAS